MTRKIINLISGPRNISTALMYSFAQRKDCRVIDEPWYASYLKRTGKGHPGRAEILASQSQDPETVLEQIQQIEDVDLVFVKNMAHHLAELPQNWWHSCHNVFLIRDPHELITSFQKVIPNPSMEDIGLKDEYDLYQSLDSKAEFPLVVLDSGEVLKNPEKVLSELCQSLSIPFYTSMLEWTPGARKEDGVWAKFWYASVHTSSGFKKAQKSKREMPAHCGDLYEEAMPFYSWLLEKSIKA
ncbi:MAG: hypothetical protein HKN16_11590 [Saprospiraceae bacterium]|nr:hypothetical protein [Saprospiraceae bacterium]